MTERFSQLIHMSVPDVVDATTLQRVVGRVPNGSKGGYGIVDRSGTLARALYLDDLQNE
jgi:hypothetical protein